MPTGLKDRKALIGQIQGQIKQYYWEIKQYYFQQIKGE